jgi:hypothetical protein
MERNILLGIIVLLVFIIGYKLYRANLENYGEVIESEFTVKKENNKTIYEKYLEYIVYLVPDTSNNKNTTITKIQNKIYEYLTPSITFAPGISTSTSTSSPSPSSSSTVPFPIDINAAYIFLIFFALVVLIFIVVKYKSIIGLFSSKKSSSDSMLLSSDGSSESSNS